MNEIVELVKKTRRASTRYTLRFEIGVKPDEVAPLMGVPLKFAEFVDCAVQGGGGAALIAGAKQRHTNRLNCGSIVGGNL
jgi:hypothetical protein